MGLAATGLQCTLEIPLGATARSAGQSDNLVRLPGGSMKRVLLVEDEAMIGMMMRELLNEYGIFVVGPCCSVEEALAEAAGEFDGALLDLNLSGQLAYPVADQLAARKIPFAFVTGHGCESLDRRFDGVPVLQKPITRESLETQLATMLGISIEKRVPTDELGTVSLKTA